MDRDRWPKPPPLAADERARVHELLDKYADKHDARAREHIARLERVARQLGRKVAAHRVTLPDATVRLDALVSTSAPTAPVPIALVPYAEASEIVKAAFAAGMREAK